jgi:membrane protein implicated in regulation of membrane protease activity
MALRTLFTAMSAFSAGQDHRVMRNDMALNRNQLKRSGALNVRAARVVAVGDRSVWVSHAGRISTVSQATDEPLRAGQSVWVSPVRGGTFVVHGSVRG